MEIVKEESPHEFPVWLFPSAGMTPRRSFAVKLHIRHMALVLTPNGAVTLPMIPPFQRWAAICANCTDSRKFLQ